MAALPLPVAILDDLIAGTGNEVIQDGDRKRKGRHFPPPSTMGVEKRALYYCCVIVSIQQVDMCHGIGSRSIFSKSVS